MGNKKWFLTNRYWVCLWSVLALAAITDWLAWTTEIYFLTFLQDRNQDQDALKVGLRAAFHGLMTVVFSLCPHMISSLCMHGEVSGATSFGNNNTPIRLEPQILTSFNLNYISKVLFPSIVTLAVGASEHKFGWVQNLVHDMEWLQCSRIRCWNSGYCQYTKAHYTLHLKLVNFIVCEL